MAKMAKRKVKAKVPARRRTGVSLIPVEKGWVACQSYFHGEMEKKDLSSSLKTWIKANYSKADQKKIFANPSYAFEMYTHYSCTAFWLTSNLPTDEHPIPNYVSGLKRYVDELIERGVALLAEKKQREKEESNIVVLSPQQRLQKKIGNTIMQDLLTLEDEWIEGEKTTLDVYQQFQRHGLSGSAVKQVRQVIEGWLLDYEDAYHKRCPQAVEGYSHLKKPELNRRIKACQDMLSDLDRIKSAAKAKRAVRIKKPVAADKQIARVQYCNANKEFKLQSINPIMIIGKQRLFTFNVKYRILTEYLTQSPNGFSIKGTTLQGVDFEQSRQTRLRKPDEFLSVVLSKTPNQIDKEFKSLTTKVTCPTNSRINKETILLRVFDK